MVTGLPVAALVPSVTARLEKSTPPIIQPSAGMTIAFTNADTILPKAAPITMPTAMSTTLPFIANSLNSAIRPMVSSRYGGDAPLHIRGGARPLREYEGARPLQRIKKSRGCPRLFHGDRGGSRHPQIGNLQAAAFLRRFGAASPLPALADFFAGAFSFFAAASFFFLPFEGSSPAGCAGEASASTSCISAIGAESPGRGPILRMRV